LSEINEILHTATNYELWAAAMYEGGQQKGHFKDKAEGVDALTMSQVQKTAKLYERKVQSTVLGCLQARETWMENSQTNMKK
jgi:hypothetical protein